MANVRLRAPTDNGLGPAMDACKMCVRALCGKSPVLDAKESMLELQVRVAGRSMPGRYPGCVQSSTLMHATSNTNTRHSTLKDGPMPSNSWCAKRKPCCYTKALLYAC
jgi:hypothetical protein